jgi:hypothetical protein
MSTDERAGKAIVGAGFPQWRGGIVAYEHGSGRSREQKYIMRWLGEPFCGIFLEATS